MVPAPSTKVAEVPAAVDMAVLSGLEREPSRRFARAREMATAIENGAPLARASEIAEWVAQMGEKELAERANVVAGIGRPGAVATARAQVQDSSEGILMAVGEATAAPRSRRRALWIVAAAVLSISAGGVVALQRRAARSVDVAAPLTQVPTTVTAGTSAPAALPGADPAAIATPRPAEAADPLPTSPSPGKTSAAGRTNPAARAPASKSRAAKAAACDPPFTIDDQGHKHYKVDCL